MRGFCCRVGSGGRGGGWVSRGWGGGSDESGERGERSGQGWGGRVREGWWRIRELGAAGRGGVSNTKDWSGVEQTVGRGHRGRGAGWVSGEVGGRGRWRR